MMENNRLVALDSWRGICALLVALYHFDMRLPLQLGPFVSNGYLFVDFFFVLSGFVMSHAYGNRLADRSSRLNFIVRRWGRLWPLHIALLLALMGVHLASRFMGKAGISHVNPEYFLANVLLVHSMGLFDYLAFNHPSWSISTEFFAYLAFAVFCLARGERLREILAVAVVLFTGTILFLQKGHIASTYDLGFIRCLYGFFTGYVVYRLALRTGRDGLWASGRMEIPASLLMVAFVGTVGHLHVLTLIAPFVFGLLVLSFWTDCGPVSRVLQARPLQKLGLWSYSIYMTHYFLIHVMWQVLWAIYHSPTLRGMPGVSYLISGEMPARYLLLVMLATALLLLSAFTYRVIEQPGRRWFNRLADRRFPPRAADPSTG